jgi:hypothetical protein
MRAALEAMEGWSGFLDKLRQVETLFRDHGYRMRFIHTCLHQEDPWRDAFKHWSTKLAGLRWHAIMNFIRDLLAISKPLRANWSLQNFSHNNQTTLFMNTSAADDKRISAELGRIDRIIKDPDFWSYSAMIFCVSYGSDWLSKWSEGCRCHQRVLAKRLYNNTELTNNIMKMQLSFPMPEDHDVSFDDVRDATTCELKSCRSAELASGEAMGYVRSVFRAAENECFFLARSCKNEGEGAKLVADFSVGVSRTLCDLTAKLFYWQLLPWKLCIISHADQQLARFGAAQCLNMWNALTPDQQRLAHPVTQRFLSPHWAGLREHQQHTDPALRGDLEEFISGACLHTLSANFLRWVAALQRIRVAESQSPVSHALRNMWAFVRVVVCKSSYSGRVEGIHSQMHGERKRAPNISGAGYSRLLRLFCLCVQGLGMLVLCPCLVICAARLASTIRWAA